MRNFCVASFILLLLLPCLTFAQGNSRVHSPRKSFQLPEGYGPEDYWQSKVIFKVKEEFRSACSESHIALPAIDKYARKLQATGIQKSFPR
ncbi:MAG: hypothetical protein RLZZ519_995, partial [Bacteroidota bacterium]